MSKLRELLNLRDRNPSDDEYHYAETEIRSLMYDAAEEICQVLEHSEEYEKSQTSLAMALQKLRKKMEVE